MNIFISGASAGIGAELAKLYSQEKINIYIIANSRIDLLADISKHCKLQKANVVYRSADVRNFDQMKEIAEDFYELFGNYKFTFIITQLIVLVFYLRKTYFIFV